jgi:hypothetical protein
MRKKGQYQRLKLLGMRNSDKAFNDFLMPQMHTVKSPYSDNRVFNLIVIGGRFNFQKLILELLNLKYEDKKREAF